MKLNIGENIKRLRRDKGITQEALSVALGVTCAAVSKWERLETLPDITLLQPLAFFFGVSVDSLLGYDEEKIRAEIDSRMNEYSKLYWTDPARATESIFELYREYPNDYRVMSDYMWNIAGSYAENDPAVLLEHKDEFREICDKLIEGCKDKKLWLDAYNMRAKLLHAEGKTEEALEIYRTMFPNWYQTIGQKSEQLFAKDTPEFLFYVKDNAIELASFAADKLAKIIYFDTKQSYEEKMERFEVYAAALRHATEATGDYFLYAIESTFLIRYANDIKYRGGKPEDVERAAQLKAECLERGKLFQTREEYCKG